MSGSVPAVVRKLDALREARLLLLFFLCVLSMESAHKKGEPLYSTFAGWLLFTMRTLPTCTVKFTRSLERSSSGFELQKR